MEPENQPIQMRSRGNLLRNGIGMARIEIIYPNAQHIPVLDFYPVKNPRAPHEKRKILYKPEPDVEVKCRSGESRAR
jgi:hypothetical protein